MNQYKTLESRYDFSKRALIAINSLLKKGVSLEAVQTIEPKPAYTFAEWAYKVYQQKKQTNSESTYNYYKRLAEYLSKWPDGKVRLDKITRSHGKAIQTYLIDSGLSNKSVNNYVSMLGTIMNEAIEEELISNNALAQIKSLPIQKGKHYPFTQNQLANIIRTLQQEDPQTALFVSFIFYLLARPNKEIRLLKIGDIMESSIRIRSEHMKTRRGRFVAIPNHLQELIDYYKLCSYEPDLYIFGQSNAPGAVPRGKTYFYRRNIKVLKSLNYTDKEYDLYSYKHSGVIALVMAGIDVEFIRAQCGHSNLSQTSRYLKDIGAIRGNEELVNNYPKIGSFF
jgi:integrase